MANNSTPVSNPATGLAVRSTRRLLGADASAAVQAPAAFKVAIKGFSEIERMMLSSVVTLSQRLPPCLELLDDEHSEHADVLLLDGADLRVKRWAADQPWLKLKPMLWVDAAHAAHQPAVLQRPVQWSMTPLLLAAAIQHRLAQASQTALSMGIQSSTR